MPLLVRLGVVDEEGAMRDDFDAGLFDLEEVLDDLHGGNAASKDSGVEKRRGSVRIKNFQLCPSSMSEYIPCLDNEETVKRFPSTERGERYERRCPKKENELNCLVPVPKGYKTPIPWPRSRYEVFP